MCILCWQTNMVPERVASIAVIAAVAVACRTGPVHQPSDPRPRIDPRPPIIQPGAPGEPSRVISPDQAADLSQVDYVGADIKFMQGMIGHHAQAVEMVAFIPMHTDRKSVV